METNLSSLSTKPLSRLIHLGCLSGLAFCFSGEALADSKLKYNYGEALQKSIYFYDQQKTGQLPPRGTEPGQNRVEWRGDSVVNDGQDMGLDLSMGYFDAGDHGKYGLPMASTFTLLSWGAINNLQAYHESGQLPYLLENILWATKYLVNAHFAPNKLVMGVGIGDYDHKFWGAPEIVHLDESASKRPSFVVTPDKPGSDVAGGTAAALAAAHILFEKANELDPVQYGKYHDHSIQHDYLEHAKQLNDFAHQYLGKYSDANPSISSFYNSWSGYQDELAWSSLWLYKATGKQQYLDSAIEDFQPLVNKNYQWTHNWDDKSYGSFILLAMITDNQQYHQLAQNWLDFWLNSLTRTPGGLAWLDQWGSLRYTANTAFLAFIYGEYLQSQGQTQTGSDYLNFAKSQINYMLGDNANNRSYVVGFGNNPPKSPHHRGASGVYANNVNAEPNDNLHTLYGALVGGPDKDGNYQDQRDDYIMNEVALDYNAAFTGALAYMYSMCQGEPECRPLSDFPMPEKRQRQEFGVDAKVNASGNRFKEFSIMVRNLTAWPARATRTLEARYFIDLSEAINQGLSPDDVIVGSNNLDGTSVEPQLKPYDPIPGIYYAAIHIEPSDNNGILRPGGQSEHRREVQFRITMPEDFADHDFTEDWSYQGIGQNQDGIGNRAKVSHIPVYEKGVLAAGTEPDGSTVTKQDRIVLDQRDQLHLTDPFTRQPLDLNTPFHLTEDEPEPVSVEILEIPQGSQIYQANGATVSSDQVITTSEFENLEIQYGTGQTLENDQFTYKGFLTDNPDQHAQTSVLVKVENEAPIVGEKTALSVPQSQNDQTTPLDLATPVDPEQQPLEVVITSLPTIGNVVLNDNVLTLNQIIDAEAVAQLVYQSPSEAPIGPAGNFTYQVSDPRGASTSQSLAVEITQPPQIGNCNINLDVNAWQSGYTLEVEITNGGDNPISNWFLQLFDANYDVVNSWNADISHNGGTTNITPQSYNQSIPSGGSVSFGFQGNGQFSQPDKAYVNNVACSINGQPADQTEQDTKAPDVPVLTVNNITTDSATLNWNQVKDNITSETDIQYHLIVNDNRQPIAPVTDPEQDLLSHALNELKPDQIYSVRIDATDQSGNTSQSNTVNIHTKVPEDNEPIPNDKTCQLVLLSETSNFWGSGATLQFELRNTSAQSIDGWQLNVTLPSNIHYSNGWGGDYQSEGQSLMIDNHSWNAQLLAKAANNTSIGFNIQITDNQYDNLNTVVEQLDAAINGQTCQVLN